MERTAELTVLDLLTPVADPLPFELLQSVFNSPCVRIERIVSRGHATPTGQWYDQEMDEFVVLLTGSAGLAIEGVDRSFEMKPGQAMLLPAHCKHRVEWTDPTVDTIWLAIFMDQS